MAKSDFIRLLDEMEAEWVKVSTKLKEENPVDYVVETYENRTRTWDLVENTYTLETAENIASLLTRLMGGPYRARDKRQTACSSYACIHCGAIKKALNSLCLTCHRFSNIDDASTT